MRLAPSAASLHANSSVAVIQRVKSASVTVDEKLVSSIGRGLLVLAGVGKEDTEKDADTLIQRILKARLWPAEEGGQVSSLYPGIERIGS